MNVRQVAAGDGQADGFGSRCNQQPVIGDPSSIREDNLPRTGVDVDGFRLETQVDVVPGIEFLPTERHPVVRGLSGKVVLGKVRAVDGRRLVVAEHDDAALELPPSQHFGRRETRRAAAYDNDFLRNLAGVIGAWLTSAPFQFLADEYAPIPLLDCPASEWVEGGRAQGLARAQIEARMMPGTADGVLDHKAIDQRPAVVCACRADCEHLVSATHQQHLVVATSAN
ncbi:hypothetical protein MPLDJ20_260184 [Mesorhizobium plurifarium]|uniref:Uncharacterized protein n=1 Tax=Mesorhizobium plurifarium TaxID=69974 RepID=A0A090FE70_MESPL|nr:hypothetical protein MPLDJ20_260184 [Mesorhizobium plurifarium]